MAFQEGDVDGSLAIARAMASLDIILAALLLIRAVTNLYLIQSDNIRLGLIGGPTSAFALSIGVLTNARRVDIFVLTATQCNASFSLKALRDTL
jgi:hypothetical protein